MEKEAVEAVEAVSHSLNLFVFCMFTVRSASGLESPRILLGFSSHWVQGWVVSRKLWKPFFE